MFEQLFNYFGGQNKLAGKLDVTTQAVSQWVKDGKIPAARAIEIEKMTGGEFKAVNLAGGK